MSQIKQIITQILDNHNIDEVIFQQGILELSNSLKPFSAGKDPIFKECRDLIVSLTTFLPESADLRTRLWHLTTKTNHIVLCKYCDSPVKWDRNAQLYRSYCSPSCKGDDPDLKLKTANTNIQKYGTISPTQNKDIRQKVTDTNMERFGCHPKQTKEVQDKFKQTCLDKYGVDNPTKSDEIKKKVVQTNLERYGCHPKQTVESKEQYKKTCLERFGCHPKQTKEVQDKFKQTCLDKYGVDNPTKSVLIRDKVKATNVELFGVENPFGSKDIQDKIKITNLNLYGTEYPSQNSSVRERVKRTNLEKYGVENFKQQHMVEILPLITNQEWLYDQYINHNKTALQISKDLGIWDGTVGAHLRKCEIAIRYTCSYSYGCINWLTSIMSSSDFTIQHALNGGEFKIPNTKYKADGYCAETNTIYEFHGDYWHGNPNVYQPAYLNKVLNKTMGELYQKTIERENIIKELGYNLITMWESDFKN